MLLPPEKVVKFKDFEGKNLILHNSANFKIKDFKIEGAIKQETREGYNLLNIDIDFPITKNGITLTRNNDGSIVANGTATAFTSIDLTPNNFLQYSSGTYRLSTFYFENNISSWYGIIKSSTDIIDISNTNDDYIFSTTQNWQLNIAINIQNGTVCNNLILPFMLISGSEEKPYEPYGASPSPDYPSEVNGLGDNYNLFNINTAQFGTLSQTDGKTISSNPEVIVSDYISVKQNTIYSINSAILNVALRIFLYDSSKNFISPSIILSSQTNKINYIIDNSTYYVRLQANKQFVNNEFMFYEGQEEKSYIPYKSAIVNVNNGKAQKQQYSLKFGGNPNVFDKNGMIELDGQFRQYGNGNITTNANYYGIKVPVEGDVTYVVKGIAWYSNLCFWTSNGGYISGQAFDNGSSFTTPSNCGYITLAVMKSAINDFKVATEDLALYKDEIPYIEGNKVYYDKKWNNLIITGNEFTESNTQIEILNNTVKVNFINILSNALVVNENKILTNLFFSKYGDNSDTEHIRNGNNKYPNNLVLYIDKSNLSSYDLAGIQALFNTKNLQVVYKITPVKTEITGGLAEQIKNLYNNIFTYKGETHLDIEEYGKISGKYLLNNNLIDEILKKIQ